MSSTKTLYIIYNANASLLGKLNYSYRKITCSKSDDPACAACDITHGGLHLDESAAWKEAKAEIARSGVEVKQLHRDELDGQLQQWIKTTGPGYPMVLENKKGATGAEFDLLMTNQDLAALKGNPRDFVDSLKSKGVI